MLKPDLVKFGGNPDIYIYILKSVFVCYFLGSPVVSVVVVAARFDDYY